MRAIISPVRTKPDAIRLAPEAAAALMPFTPMNPDSGFIGESYDAMVALRCAPDNDDAQKSTLQFSTRILLRQALRGRSDPEVDRVAEGVMAFIESGRRCRNADRVKAVLMRSICSYHPHLGIEHSPDDDFFRTLCKTLSNYRKFPKNEVLQNLVLKAFHQAEREGVHSDICQCYVDFQEHVEVLILSWLSLSDPQESLFRKTSSAATAVIGGQTSPEFEKQLLLGATWCVFRHLLPKQKPEMLEQLATTVVRTLAYKEDNGMLINALGDMHQGLTGAVNLSRLALRVQVLGINTVLAELESAQPSKLRTLHRYSDKQLAGWTDQLLNYTEAGAGRFPLPGLRGPVQKNVEKYNGLGQSAENVLRTLLSGMIEDVTETRVYKQNREDIALLLETNLERALCIAFDGQDNVPRPIDVTRAAAAVFGEEADGFLLQSIREQARRICLNSDIAEARNHLVLMKMRREVEISELKKVKQHLHDILQNTTDIDSLSPARAAVSNSENQVRACHERVDEAEQALKAAAKLLEEYNGGTTGLNFDALAAGGAGDLKKRLRHVWDRAKRGTFRFSPDVSLTVQLMEAMAVYLQQASSRLAANSLGVAMVYARTEKELDNIRQDERIHTVLRAVQALSPEVREAWIARNPQPVQAGDVVQASEQKAVLQEIDAYRTLASYLRASTPENFDDAAKAIKEIETIHREAGRASAQTLSGGLSDWLPSDPLKFPAAGALDTTKPFLTKSAYQTTIDPIRRMRDIILKTATVTGLGLQEMLMDQGIKNKLYDWVWPPAVIGEPGEPHLHSPAEELLMISPHQMKFDENGILRVETTAQAIRELIAKYPGDLSNPRLHQQIAHVLKQDGIIYALSEKLETASISLDEMQSLTMKTGKLLSRNRRETGVNDIRLSADERHVVTEVINILSTENEESDATLFNAGLIKHIEMKSGFDIPDDSEEAWLILYQNYLSAQDEWYRHLNDSNAEPALKHEYRKRLVSAHFSLSALEAEFKGDLSGGRDAYIKGLDILKSAKSNATSVQMNILKFNAVRSSNGDNWSSQIDIPNLLVLEKAATRDEVGGVVLYDSNGAWSYYPNRSTMYQYLDIRRLEQNQLAMSSSILRRSVLQATPCSQRMQMLRYFSELDQRADLAAEGTLSVIALEGDNFEKKFDRFVDIALAQETVNREATKLEYDSGQAKKELTEFLSKGLVNYEERLRNKTSMDLLSLFRDKGISLNSTIFDANDIELTINNLSGTAVEWVDNQYRNRQNIQQSLQSDSPFVSNNHIPGKIIHFIVNVANQLQNTFTQDNNDLARGAVRFTKVPENFITGKSSTEAMAILNGNTELQHGIIDYFRRTYTVDQYRNYLTENFMPPNSEFNSVWTRSERLNLKLAVDNSKWGDYITEGVANRILLLIEDNKDPRFLSDKIGGLSLSCSTSKVEIPGFYTFTLEGNTQGSGNYIYIPDELYGQNLYTEEDFNKLLKNDYGNIWNSIEERTLKKDSELIRDIRAGVKNQKFVIKSDPFNHLSERANTMLLGYISDLDQKRSSRWEVYKSLIMKTVGYASAVACLGSGGTFTAACGASAAVLYANGVKEVLDEMESGNLDDALLKAWMLPLDAGDMLPAFAQLLKLTGRSAKALSHLSGKPVKTAQEVSNAMDTVLSWKKFFLKSGELSPDVAVKNLDFSRLRVDSERARTMGEFWITAGKPWELGDKTWIKSNGHGYEVYSNNGWADIRLRDPSRPNAQGPIVEWKNGRWSLQTNVRMPGGGKNAAQPSLPVGKPAPNVDDAVSRNNRPRENVLDESGFGDIVDNRNLIRIRNSEFELEKRGYRFIGYHGTNTYNLRNMVDKGLDPKFVGTGDGEARGSGFYITRSYENARDYADASTQAGDPSPPRFETIRHDGDKGKPEVVRVYAKNFNEFQRYRDFMWGLESSDGDPNYDRRLRPNDAHNDELRTNSQKLEMVISPSKYPDLAVLPLPSVSNTDSAPDASLHPMERWQPHESYFRR